MSDARVILFGAGLGLVAVIVVAIVGKRAITAASATLNAFNPANNNNVIAGGVNSIGETISGTNGWSLGAWIWELNNPGARAAEREMLQ